MTVIVRHVNKRNKSIDTNFVYRMTRDWRKVLNSSPTYRITNGTVQFQTKFATFIAILGAGVLILLYGFIHFNKNSHQEHDESLFIIKSKKLSNFNSTYPLTPPKYLPHGVKYKIGIIADLDTFSKSKSNPNVWISYFKKGYLTWNSSKRRILVAWDDNPVILKSGYGLSGRGMELSELITYDGKLLTFDDRTGLIYEMVNNDVIPWIILTDGNGKQNKGFKSEWSAIKDNQLYIGSIGKEWTTNEGKFLNDNPLWIKIVSPHGDIQHINWTNNYEKLRKSVGIQFPGYMIHESAVWSNVHNRWVFLPRRASPNSYNDLDDELRGTNLLLLADDTFNHIEVKRIGDIAPLRGFSSFKFLPETNDHVIIALKSEEHNYTSATYMLGFTIDGEILFPETKIADKKYEGIEFI